MYLSLSLSLYLSLSLHLSLFFFVDHIMFSHDPHQFCEVSVWSGRPEGFESNTANMQNSDQGRPRAARAAKKRGPKGNQILNKMGTGRAP